MTLAPSERWVVCAGAGAGAPAGRHGPASQLPAARAAATAQGECFRRLVMSFLPLSHVLARGFRCERLSAKSGPQQRLAAADRTSSTCCRFTRQLKPPACCKGPATRIVQALSAAPLSPVLRIAYVGQYCSRTGVRLRITGLGRGLRAAAVPRRGAVHDAAQTGLCGPQRSLFLTATHEFTSVPADKWGYDPPACPVPARCTVCCQSARADYRVCSLAWFPP